jgi:hypothetical protein
MMTDPASAIKREVFQLVELQIETLQQEGRLTDAMPVYFINHPQLSQCLAFTGPGTLPEGGGASSRQGLSERPVATLTTERHPALLDSVILLVTSGGWGSRKTSKLVSD